MSKLAKKYRKLSLAELEKQEQALRKEIANLALQMSSNAAEVKDPMSLSNKRQRLAVLLTIKNEKSSDKVKS